MRGPPKGFDDRFPPAIRHDPLHPAPERVRSGASVGSAVGTGSGLLSGHVTVARTSDIILIKLPGPRLCAQARGAPESPAS
jgi:hypothetical protein